MFTYAIEQVLTRKKKDRRCVFSCVVDRSDDCLSIPEACLLVLRELA